jgi:FkbM family methyltransferase
MEQEIRSLARQTLPPAIRKPLGSVAGVFNRCILRPIFGLIFDLKGGKFRADGCVFTVPKDVTTMTYRSCFLSGDYEREERELIRRWVKPEDSVLEFGACLGIVSCSTNKLLKDKSRHVVVEANPFCIATIYRNRKLNNSGFLIEHCAVSNESEVVFYLHPVYIVGGTTQRATNQPVRLPAKSFRQLDKERGPFNVLIIDIEGSEKDVFEASIDLLKRYRLVIMELHEFAIGADGVERCRKILRDCGLTQVGQAGITEAWQRP